MKKTIVLFLGMLFLFSKVANADLTIIGTAAYEGVEYNLIYEGEIGGQGLVWLDYTSDKNNWDTQMNWASELGDYLTINLYPGYTTDINWSNGWRLPSSGDNPQIGYNQTTSEMGHLYYDSLGKSAGGPLGDTSPFEYLQDDYYYWSGTEYSAWPEFFAWFFSFDDGELSNVEKEVSMYSLAVHSGEVEFNPVPEPATMLLLGSGLIGLAGARRKFKK